MIKLINKILNYIRSDMKLFFIVVIVININFISIPKYSIDMPGSIINVTNNLTNKKYDSNGSFNMTSVSESKGTLIMLILGKIIPSYDIVDNSDYYASNEDSADMSKRARVMLESGISNAIYLAYKEANYDVNITDSHYYITYISDKANTNLSIGDEIIKIDNKDITNKDELSDILNGYNEGDKLDILVKRNNKEMDAYAYLYKDDDSILKIGIALVLINKYDNNPNITYKYAYNEYGSSGGLMLTLGIYDALTENDLTKGKKIAGTGTIELDGTVGEISGVKYKLAGAVKNKCDVFIVPENNYEEAKSLVEKNNYNIKLIKANNFEQVLTELQNLE